MCISVVLLSFSLKSRAEVCVNVEKNDKPLKHCAGLKVELIPSQWEQFVS